MYIYLSIYLSIYVSICNTASPRAVNPSSKKDMASGSAAVPPSPWSSPAHARETTAAPLARSKRTVSSAHANATSVSAVPWPTKNRAPGPQFGP